MCGRFLLTYDIQAIKNFYNIPADEHVVYAPLPEICPSQKIPVIIQAQGVHHLQMMDWGFPKPQGKGLLINARGETAAVKPTFRRAFQQGRCLIPANGFYEWKQEGSQKIKYRIQRQDGQLFSMAGLFRQAEVGSDGYPMCVIITCEPNPKLAQIHNRMPAILPREAEKLWLDEKQQNIDLLTRLLLPFDPEGSILTIEKA